MKARYEIVQKIEDLLSNCLNYMKNLTPENFEVNFNGAVESIKSAHNLKAELQLLEITPELTEHIRKINITTKQINNEYDNIIRNYSSEINRVRLAIREAGARKKLANYSTGKL